MNNNEIYENDFDAQEELVMGELKALLDRLPKSAVLVLNLPRYKEVCEAISKINKIVLKVSPDAKISTSYDDFTGTCLIYTVVVDELSITQTKQFAETLTVSDTMSVVPLANGNLEIGFTFEDVRLPAPPLK